MNKYVIGDIHGTYEALIQCLERSGFDYENDLLITLGDIVDGFSGSFKVVEELLKIKNRIDIIGNHDEWFHDFLNFGIHPDSWSQGGLGTAKSYAEGIGIEFKYTTKVTPRVRQLPKREYMTNLISSDIPESHVKFFRGQHKYYKDEDNNIFVHGGFVREMSVKNTPIEICTWDRKMWNQALSAKATKSNLRFTEEVKNVFIGHTSTLSWGSDLPMKADKVWNIDTGGGGEGKLTIMNVDTEEFWQSDLVDELYPEETNNR